MHSMVKVTMGTLAFVQGWFLLPRRSERSVVNLKIKIPATKNGECPRLHPTKFVHIIHCILILILFFQVGCQTLVQT